LIGIGEMGGVFARGFLRLGYPVYPVTRQMSLASELNQIAEPELVLLAVGESDLQAVLAEIPTAWRDKLGLLQNELLPQNWQGIEKPTVISVWFEKKPGIEAKVIIPSPVFGPHAALISQALATLEIPTKVLHSSEQLLFELVLKNLYILTSNIAGLRTGGTVGELWTQHQQFARTLATEVIQIQQVFTNETLDSEALITAMVTAFEGDPAHRCMGRSAPDRLTRALTHADRFGLAVPLMRELQASLTSS
jgi:hypothetical protein